MSECTHYALKSEVAITLCYYIPFIAQVTSEEQWKIFFSAVKSVGTENT